MDEQEHKIDFNENWDGWEAIYLVDGEQKDRLGFAKTKEIALEEMKKRHPVLKDFEL